MEAKKQIPRKLLFKFISLSLIGAFAFMIPLKYGESANTFIGILTDWVKSLLGFCMNELILGLVTFSAVGSMVDYILTKAGKAHEGKLHTILKTNIIYLITKILALAIVIMCYFGIGPVQITSDDVGGTMIGLGKSLIALAISFSYLLPFLTEAGLMEFIGEITKPFVRPLFKVPSDASLDLIASWLGAANAAVLLSAEKYHQ